MSKPLFDAIRAHDHLLVNSLLDHGVELHKADEEGWLPLHVAIGEIGAGGTIEIVKMLIDYGAGINDWNVGKDKWDSGRNETPLISACVAGLDPVLKLLLESGANPNVRNSVGDSPLRLCVWENELAMVSMLLAYGADATIDDYGGDFAWTALGIAAHNFNLQMIRILLRAGADSAALDDLEHTARDRLPPRDQHDPNLWDDALELLS